ncbi:hypothetical protein T552_00227 [Pneumocystis carinii B80]|uniref:Uncharacterized protein n=1 Tax=Pneumocystis carinii (strain B80) TaxID=1408658 RepID=A0A0W4ZT92_PNEC8|nr:hypothetical protein T552_00227 [Pneumocystis carinii B80]KTW31589.1 hypothetical protein T552_00227 [Pneumocystis carinii B80]
MTGKTLEIVNSEQAPPPIGPYSQAIKANGLIFCSGQLPALANGCLVTTSIKEQTKACLDNLRHVLEAGNSSLEKVIKVTVFLSDMCHFKEFNETYEKIFGSHRPARCCVAVRELPRSVDVEIECIAIEN